MSGPVAVAAWDANSRAYQHWPHREEAENWALQHDLLTRPDTDVYRIEITLADCPFARIFSYAVDADGRRYLDPATRRPAQNEPAVRILSELPPPHLRQVMA